jgi:ribonuclease P protein component
MSDVASVNTGIAPACGPVADAPSSGTAGLRVGVGSLPSNRPFVSLASSRFGAVYREGRRSKADGVLVISAAGESGRPQVGIVAGRTVGNAVRRNRAKRRLREAMSQVELRPDTTYVVVASPEVVAVPFDELRDRLRAAIVECEESRR